MHSGKAGKNTKENSSNNNKNWRVDFFLKICFYFALPSNARPQHAKHLLCPSPRLSTLWSPTDSFNTGACSVWTCLACSWGSIQFLHFTGKEVGFGGVTQPGLVLPVGAWDDSERGFIQLFRHQDSSWVRGWYMSPHRKPRVGIGKSLGDLQTVGCQSLINSLYEHFMWLLLKLWIDEAVGPNTSTETVGKSGFVIWCWSIQSSASSPTACRHELPQHLLGS